MSRINRRIVAALVVMVFLVSVVTIKASAASGYAKKDMKNSYSYTQYRCSFWSQSNFWDVWWGANGTSNTAWLGSTPYNADNITHKDILSCTGIGSMSIGASPSGPNTSASISGSSATYSYSLSNTWRIDVNFTYKHTGLLAAWNYSMRTVATVQFGSTFYSWGN